MFDDVVDSIALLFLPGAARKSDMENSINGMITG
jgi:hypothetical protein